MEVKIGDKVKWRNSIPDIAYDILTIDLSRSEEDGQILFGWQATRYKKKETWHLTYDDLISLITSNEVIIVGRKLEPIKSLKKHVF